MLTFLKDALAGYEPAVVRSFAVAVFVLLAAFGIGSGDLPGQVEAVLTFLTFIVPIAFGFLIRAKVTPTKDQPQG